MDIKGSNFFCSWSGGKDSSLALYYAIQAGGNPDRLLTMVIEDGTRSRSHGLSIDVLNEQVSSLGISLITRSTSWDEYEEKFLSTIKEFRKDGIRAGVFGDIDLEEHREWVERICKLGDIRPYLPLWKRPRRKLVEEFIELGFKSTIISLKDSEMDRKYLGQVLDMDLVEEFEEMGIDASGEGGEFHTVVTDGPIFNFEIPLKFKEQIYRDGYWFLDVSV